MIDYGLKDKVVLITGANNPWGIGATTVMLQLNVLLVRVHIFIGSNNK